MMEADCTGGTEPMHTIPDYLVLAQKKREAERAVIEAVVAWRKNGFGVGACLPGWDSNLANAIDRLIAIG